jgi:trehalose 6-phosphate phosphatase
MMPSQSHTVAPDPGSISLQQVGLFLDLDGTLVDLQPQPHDVRIDGELIGLLRDLSALSGGALALISGRPIAQLTSMIAPLQMPMAGIHGIERLSARGILHRPTIFGDRLDALRAALAGLVERNPGVLLEDKGVAIALHFRLAPWAALQAAEVMRHAAQALGPEFEMLEGNCVLEIKPSTHNKATAIEAFMQESPFSGRMPIYIGDDRTDFDGFGAVRRHDGIDIGVGEAVPARWRLENPAAVRSWLFQLTDRRPST